MRSDSDTDGSSTFLVFVSLAAVLASLTMAQFGIAGLGPGGLVIGAIVDYLPAGSSTQTRIPGSPFLVVGVALCAALWLAYLAGVIS